MVRLTVVCMFVFAIGVTVALIVHVAALHHSGVGYFPPVTLLANCWSPE